ncbi:MAG TPA: hypothetical protein VFS21_18045 [Roseiflexaceae bacterium]|nr:hypothetical protein [Roseiflexaceae bacterium]
MAHWLRRRLAGTFGKVTQSLLDAGATFPNVAMLGEEHIAFVEGSQKRSGR